VFGRKNERGGSLPIRDRPSTGLTSILRITKRSFVRSQGCSRNEGHTEIDRARRSYETIARVACGVHTGYTLFRERDFIRNTQKKFLRISVSFCSSHPLYVQRGPFSTIVTPEIQ